MASLLMPTLYNCRARTAFHVHTSHLLRNTFECRKEFSINKEEPELNELELVRHLCDLLTRNLHFTISVPARRNCAASLSSGRI